MMRRFAFLLVALLTIAQGAWATTPNGSFDGCTAIDGGIRVYGWTYDPDAPTESLNIHIYLYDANNSLLSITSMGNTGRMRADVNQTFGISGTHGFDYYIPITTAGTYFVELYAIDATDPINENKLIGERKAVAVTTPWSAKETVSSEVDLMLATAAGGSFKLGADIQLTSYLYVAPDKTVTLDLNGKTLSRSLAAADNMGSVIRVDNGGTLTVKDSSGNNSGKVTGGRATNGGGITNHGTLTFEGGTITDCSASNGGGGIFNAPITVGNTPATLTMTGGTITGNRADLYGGGVFTYSSFSMSGNPVITGNIGPNNGKENLYLAENAMITVTEAFTTGAKVGITNFSLSRVLTSGYSTYNSGTAPTSIFSSDVANYDITLNDNGEVLARGNWGAEQELEYIHRSWDGSKVVSEKVTAMAKRLNDINAGGGTRMLSGTYYVIGGYDSNGYIGVDNGQELNIIVCDEAILNTKGLIIHNKGTLRIFTQEHGNGRIIANPDREKPGIGQAKYDGGIIEIHGGIITAAGGLNAAGIGEGIWYDRGDKSASFDRLDIYGGNITASGGEMAAGIGGSYRSRSGVLNIYGGTIVATGGRKASGIGIGGSDYIINHNEPVNIYGGSVYAYAGMDGAGIGGGHGDCQVTISGGYVEAHGDTENSYGAGIGCGQQADGGTVIISGGTVIAWGGIDSAGIGCGEEVAMQNPNRDAGTITITGGNVTAYGKGWGCGIGGGERAAMGNITITGGTVHAVAGSDNNGTKAIGGHDTKDGDNSLVIGNNMKAWDSERSAMNSERYAFCEYRGEVCLSTCDHNGTYGAATFTDKGNGTHDVANCIYCYTTNEAHTIGDDGVCTRCHGCIVLSDTEDCGGIIYGSEGLTANVKLDGRTFYKDGSWNTICLPFDVTIAGSVLDGDGVQVRQLNADASNLNDGLLTLTFEDVPDGVLKASKPYLIKWNHTGSNLVSPTFEKVTFATSMPGFDIFDGGFWQGNFSPVFIDEDNIDEILLLSADNKMGYSQEPRMLHSFRAHVEITAERDSDDDVLGTRAVTRTVIDFGDGETTGIIEVKSDGVRSEKFDDGWYDLQGRKLNGEPVRAGVYIHKGKKVKR